MTNSRITSLALMVAAMAAVGSAFPVTVELHNNTWTHGVEPETCTEAAAYTSATMVIRDADQFQRVLSNLEGVNHLSGWVDGAGLFIVLPGADEALAAAAERQAQSAAATNAAAAGSEGDVEPKSDQPSDLATDEPAAEPAAEAVKPAGKQRK